MTTYRSHDTYLSSYIMILLFLLAFASADIIFHKFLELHSTLSEKKIFVMNFPFLTDSLKGPRTPLTAKIRQAWQKLFVDAP